MDTNNVVSYVAIVVSVASVVLGVINHRRIRSNCCGRIGVVSLDVEPSSPAQETTLDKNPEPKQNGGTNNC